MGAITKDFNCLTVTAYHSANGEVYDDPENPFFAYKMASLPEDFARITPNRANVEPAFLNDEISADAMATIKTVFGDVEIIPISNDTAAIDLARSEEDLSGDVLSTVSNDKTAVASVLPKIRPNKTGVYLIGVRRTARALSENLKGTLEWHGFPDSMASEAVQAADSDTECLFLNTVGEAITSPTNSYLVYAAVKLTEGVTYAPVVTVSKNGNSEDTENGNGEDTENDNSEDTENGNSEDTENGNSEDTEDGNGEDTETFTRVKNSSGCDGLFGGLAMLVLAGFVVLKSKR